ncbi:MAG: EF-P lysine aminoacylase GenX [Gammaproteobacteria bacterium]|nr:EF-P lysine aminoacylase GenX [Gammaproteobacteria bacterium]
MRRHAARRPDAGRAGRARNRGYVVNSAPPDWRPGASRARLRRRAQMLASIRAFFATRGVLEVDTPQLVNHAVTDVNIHSAEVRWRGANGPPRYLHSSPEYAMKRLLAAGSGDIYQMCHAFRGEEQGALHSSEFMIVEWYRLGWTMAALMDEVDQLLRCELGAAAGGAARYLSYEQVFLDALDLRPLDATDSELAGRARACGFERDLVRRCGRDELLDLLMGVRIGPALGMDGPVFVHRYPASQAALARLDPDDARVGLRFELYLRGMELANGFEELGDPLEQRRRFADDQRARAARNLPVPAMDEYLLAALAAGLPPCAGVALGFDRLLMIASEADRIDEVQAFDSARA